MLGTPKTARRDVAKLSTCGTFLVLFPPLKRYGPSGSVMWPNRPFVGHCLVFSLALILWDPPSGRGYLGKPRTLLWRFEVLWTPAVGTAYVAKLPSLGPVLILSLMLKRLRPPKQQRLCSQSTNFGATSECLCRFEVLGTPPSDEPLCSHP